MANQTKLTARKKKKFAEILSTTANVSRACRTIGISRFTAYQHKKDDPEFAQAWDDALEEGTDALVEEAIRRARDGVEEPVYYQGEVVGTVLKPSDTLAIFLLKSHRPEVYRETIRQEIDISKLSDEELQHLARIAPKLTPSKS